MESCVYVCVWWRKRQREGESLYCMYMHECIRLQIWHHRVDMLHWTSSEKVMRMKGSRNSSAVATQSPKFTILVTANVDLDLNLYQNTHNIGRYQQSWGTTTIFCHLIENKRSFLTLETATLRGLTFHQISVKSVAVNQTQTNKKDWRLPQRAWDIKIRLESCQTWREEKGRVDVQRKGFPQWLSVCQLSHKSHGNRWRTGERSSADNHYLWTWCSDYGSLNRLCQSHNHRNQ